MILDQYGKPMQPSRTVPAVVAQRLQGELRQMRAKYDAVANGDALVNHWRNADNLSPDAANTAAVRQRLRSRSRYEIIENNPYLKGTVLTIANDFVGSGAKLQVTDKRISKDARQFIERSYHRWVRLTRYRQKLWRMRMGKVVDGEGIKVAYNNWRIRHPVKLDFQVIEADLVTSLGMFNSAQTENEVDGVRFDRYGNPTHYHILDRHPGGMFPTTKGTWVNARFVTHWYRQDRGWLRGIPEITPSLPLCALLRRYTLAVVKAAESAADFAILLESEIPPAASAQLSEDNPFETFPIEQGMITTLPWGYKMSQIDAKQPVQMYDMFVNALLREIIRPLMTPFNLASGSSKDANMSSAVVDTHIYKEAQRLERLHATEEIVEPDYDLWWSEYIKTREFHEAPELAGALQENPSLLFEPPDHIFRWDPIGLEHTDPAKVMKALETARKNNFITDRDIQETRYNRDIEDWRAEVEEQLAWEKKNGINQPAAVETEEEEEEETATADE